MNNIIGLTARRIAYFAWRGTGLEPEETINGFTQMEYAEVIQKIIDRKGPRWVLEEINE